MAHWPFRLPNNAAHNCLFQASRNSFPRVGNMFKHDAVGLENSFFCHSAAFFGLRPALVEG
jgi:hypothetical protein